MKKKTKGSVSRRGFIGSVSALMGGGFLGLSAQSKHVNENSPGQEGKKIREYRTLGRTGFKVSDISLGGVELTTPALVRAAFDAGINYIDTAEGYLRGQSVNIGKALRTMTEKKSLSVQSCFFAPTLPKRR